jgi:alkanesulfonate monooxygenase SsuD/methylene tetrahydromethanopterin reductase-like flavin-dependent oxidoreductase (luciferase family)
MQNDISRQWAFLTPFVPGEMFTAQAKQIESLGMAGIFLPEIYSDPMMGMGYVAAVTERVKIASGIKIAFASNPFEIAMSARRSRRGWRASTASPVTASPWPTCGRASR